MKYQDLIDPQYQAFIDAHIIASARTYADGLQRSGLTPNPTLSKAMAERAVRAAHVAYRKRHPVRAFLRNVRLVVMVLCALAAAEDGGVVLVRHQGLLLALACLLFAAFALIVVVVTWRKEVAA